MCVDKFSKPFKTLRKRCSKRTFHITEKYRGSAHRDCNINLKLNHKIPIVFYSLENYDYHLIMQELGKFNYKVNVTRNGLEKNIWALLSVISFIESFQFLCSSLDSLVKHLNKGDFKYLSQEFHKNKIDLLKQKGF